MNKVPNESVEMRCTSPTDGTVVKSCRNCKHGTDIEGWSHFRACQIIADFVKVDHVCSKWQDKK